MARPGEFTTEQIRESIASAIREANWPAVDGLMRLLAVQDPAAAADVLATLRIALEMTR